jgi:hypothetical protein
MEKVKKLILVVVFMLTFCTAYSQYDPPIGRTSYYHLRMWGDGDRPGADSVNRNLIDIDLYLHNINTYITNVEGSVSNLNAYVLTLNAKTNDSVYAHNVKLNILNDSVYAHNVKLNAINDTLFRIPRLNLENAFTENNSFTHLSISDNGSTALLQFNPGHLHSSIVKSGNDTLFLSYNNGNTAYGTWNFQNVLNVNGVLKENNTVGHLISSFGEAVNTGLWVATEQNGQATTQLRAVPITINGATVYILYFNP